MVSKFIEKYMALIVLVVASLALFFPHYFLIIKLSYINFLLMIIMFGMGLTLKIDDFKILVTCPKNILFGCVSQYLIMPILALMLAKLFNLNDALLVGVVLVGACPGGTASNVITFLSKGDVAYSVGMTTINTLIAPFLTPVIVYAILRQVVNIDVFAMFISIFNIIIVPIVLGLIVNKLFSHKINKIIRFLPSVSIFAISLIIVSVVSHNSAEILNTAGIIFIVVILHNILGYLSGFAIGKLLKMEFAQVKALSIEIGMQNSGLATSLAATTFSSLALATVPGAIFSVWHNLSGAIIANIYSRFDNKEKAGNYGM